MCMISIIIKIKRTDAKNIKIIIQITHQYRKTFVWILNSPPSTVKYLLVYFMIEFQDINAKKKTESITLITKKHENNHPT